MWSLQVLSILDVMSGEGRQGHGRGERTDQTAESNSDPREFSEYNHNLGR